jgi:hypothetical protein
MQDYLKSANSREGVCEDGLQDAGIRTLRPNPDGTVWIEDPLRRIAVAGNNPLDASEISGIVID